MRRLWVMTAQSRRRHFFCPERGQSVWSGMNNPPDNFEKAIKPLSRIHDGNSASEFVINSLNAALHAADAGVDSQSINILTKNPLHLFAERPLKLAVATGAPNKSQN